MDKKPHKRSCLIYLCTCEVRESLDKLKELQEEIKEKIEELEDTIDRGCED